MANETGGQIHVARAPSTLRCCHVGVVACCWRREAADLGSTRPPSPILTMRPGYRWQTFFPLSRLHVYAPALLGLGVMLLSSVAQPGAVSPRLQLAV